MTPAVAFGWFLQVWLLAIAVLILYRLLTRRLSLNGLFTTHHGRFSPERMQLLFVTAGGLGQFIVSTLQTRSMDGVPDLIAILAASHAIYLGGKAIRH